MAYHFLSYDSYRRICNVIHTLEDVIANINDDYEASNIVWSSQKIEDIIADMEEEIDDIIDDNATNKLTISLSAMPGAPTEDDKNKLFFEPKTDENGQTYYDNYIYLGDSESLFLGSSIFEKDKYYTIEEMEERYGPIDNINKMSSFAPISSKSFYSIMTQEDRACEDMFLSTHDNLEIPNVSQEGLIVGGAFPIGDGFILESYRNGLAYWSIKLIRGNYNLADETPSAVGADTLISEMLVNKDSFGKACAAWPELRDAQNNEEWIIPLHSKLLMLDESPITYRASLVIKNAEEDTVDESKIMLYLRASEEIPPGTELFGSTCFTINHTR